MPFPMQVQSLERTLIDKLFALCDYYIQNKAARNSRHLYDIYKLGQQVVVDENFKSLVTEVRKHRLEIKDNVAPSAEPSVDIAATIKEFCDKDFYENEKMALKQPLQSHFFIFTTFSKLQTLHLHR